MGSDKDIEGGAKGSAGRLKRRLVPPQTDSLIRAILACKWTLTVFQLLRAGVVRPGAMVDSVEGLSTKSLNECLRRLQKFDLVHREAFPEVPPRVEYALTRRGEAVAAVFDQIVALESAPAGQPGPPGRTDTQDE